MIELLTLPPCPGSIDVLKVVDGRLSVHGWMFQPSLTFERIEAHLDGRPIGPVPCVSRPDVERVFEWAKDAKPAAFALEMAFAGAAPTRVDVVGLGAKGPAARLSCFFPSAAEERLPQPPDDLQERVAGFHGPVFRDQGLRMFTDLVDQMARLKIPVAGRILDWGCGCGRVTRHLVTRLPQARIVGCDIDEQAIEWCRRSLLGAEFIRVEPMPPTPLDEAAVDVAIACSVLTHLAEAVQDEWLDEMRRILAPGGYLLASTQGDYAFQLAHRGARTSKGRSVWKRLLGSDRAPSPLSGVEDSALDPALDGIAPPGYYRGVFQSRAHTAEVCAKHFEVVDYVERGLNGHQDLVILRRPR